jgi:hypothetical protein
MFPVFRNAGLAYVCHAVAQASKSTAFTIDSCMSLSHFTFEQLYCVSVWLETFVFSTVLAWSAW